MRAFEKRAGAASGSFCFATVLFSTLMTLSVVAGGSWAAPVQSMAQRSPHEHLPLDAHDHTPGHYHGSPRDRLSSTDFKGAPKDVVLWGELAKVGITRESGRYKARFMPSTLALDGKTVALVGFMAPVHPGRKEKQFLLSDTRFLCDTCASVPSPQSIVEVNTRVGEPVHDRPITVRGKLQLVKDDPNGLVYRLRDAKVIHRPRQ